MLTNLLFNDEIFYSGASLTLALLRALSIGVTRLAYSMNIAHFKFITIIKIMNSFLLLFTATVHAYFKPYPTLPHFSHHYSAATKLQGEDS